MDKRLEEIRARADAATPPPWNDGDELVGHSMLARLRDFSYTFGDPQLKIDADFVAHARVDIPYLLDQLTHSQGRIAELEEVVAVWTGHALSCSAMLLNLDGKVPCDCGWAEVEARLEQQPATLTKGGGE